jgi:prepilin signal peptidase PulO-like enzyme (type II secretory pathway)
MTAWMMTGLFFALGIVLGSFGNVVIARFPKNKSLMGRSACMQCKRVLTPLELIPVASFLFLNGRCHGCGKPISWRYPLVEFSSALLFVLALPLAGFDFFAALALAIVFWAMLLIVVIDSATQMIPDALTIVLSIAAIAFHLLSGAPVAIEGGLVAGIFFGTQWLLSRGNWVGSGDVFLGIALGVLLGSWQDMIIALMTSYIIGMVFAIILLLLKRATKKSHLAFGPFLVAGAFVSLLWADAIITKVLP